MHRKACSVRHIFLCVKRARMGEKRGLDLGVSLERGNDKGGEERLRVGFWEFSWRQVVLLTQVHFEV